MKIEAEPEKITERGLRLFFSAEKDLFGFFLVYKISNSQRIKKIDFGRKNRSIKLYTAERKVTSS